MLRQRWPEIRASLIALSIALGLVDGCPLAPPEYMPDWQREIAAVVRPVQQGILSPFRWVTSGLRFKQRWALFQVAEAERFRLEVLVRSHGDMWSVLFRAGDPDHAAYADQLEHRRVRGAWNPADKVPSQYAAFGRWFTQRVLDDHPDVDEVRVRFEKVVLERGKVIATGVYVAPFARTRGSK